MLDQLFSLNWSGELSPLIDPGIQVVAVVSFIAQMVLTLLGIAALGKYLFFSGPPRRESPRGVPPTALDDASD